MKSISYTTAYVFEILHCVQDDKMKADFYFDTPLLGDEYRLFVFSGFLSLFRWL